MAEFSTPIAKRLQRPHWRDSRLIIGVFLVLLAVTLGAKAIGAADHRVPRYAAAEQLKAGDRLDRNNLVRVDVQLGSADEIYLAATGALPDDLYALRDVRRGELVPTSAVGSADQLSVQPVSVRVDQVQAATLTEGSVVDVYVTASARTTGASGVSAAAASGAPAGTSAVTPGRPSRLLEATTVGRVTRDTARFGGTGGNTAVQLLVPREKVPAVIAAIDDEMRVTLVPVPGAVAASGS